MDLSINKLCAIPVFNLAHLTTLDLSRNQLTTVKFEGNLPSLDQLILNFNNLPSLDFSTAYNGFPNISVLCCSNNNISAIDPMFLKQEFKKLKHLDLSNNNLIIVPPKLGLIELTNLQLMGNPFRVPRPALLQQGKDLFALII